MQRVRVQDLLPDQYELEMPDGRVWPIGTLSIDDMLALFEAERQVAEAAQGEGGPVEMLQAMKSANELLNDFLNDRSPNMEGGPAEYSLPPQTLTVIFAMLSGNESVRAEVEQAMLAAIGDGGKKDEPGAEGEAPLASTKRSRASSSKSGKRTGGRGSGGASSPAPGKRSRSTSGSSERTAA